MADSKLLKVTDPAKAAERVRSEVISTSKPPTNMVGKKST
jgi:hypothetical protein